MVGLVGLVGRVVGGVTGLGQPVAVTQNVNNVWRILRGAYDVIWMNFGINSEGQSLILSKTRMSETAIYV